MWLVAFGLVSSAWCWTAGRELGATFDEPVYIARGLDFWRTGSHSGLMKLGTMPLPVDLDTLPLYLWETWQGIRLDPDRGLEQVLPCARLGTLVFWWLLLIYGRLAGRQLAGPWGGRLAVALLACEPNLLAHASLATTDIAISACLLALVYHFRTGRDERWFWRIGVPAFWFGAAVLGKASGLVFGLICMVLLELEHRLRQGTQVDREVGHGLVRRCFGIVYNRRFRWEVAQIAALGMGLAFVYCGCDWRTQPAFVEWAHRLPEGAYRRTMVWLADHLCIFSNAGEGLVRQVKHNMRGHGTYVLGVSQDRAIWYYFPVALSIKLTITLLALPLVLAVVRPRALANWACLAALALLAFSLTCRVQIGIRLMLPLVVLAIVGLAGAAVNAGQSMAPGWPRRMLAAATGAGLAWTALAAIGVWPHGLCYVNEFWGGTSRGFEYLSDSNYDWGQGLKELVRWQERHQLTCLDVWYFGRDPALTQLPLREVPLHVPPLAHPADVLARVPGRYLAASTTMVYGNVTTTPEHRRAAAFLRALRPVDRTTTYLIYDLARIRAERQFQETLSASAHRR
jgi:hypothetical protein